MRVCRDCLKTYRRNNKGVRKVNGKWPSSHVYHLGSGRYCEYHSGYRNAESSVRRIKRMKREVEGSTPEIKAVYLEAAKRRMAGERVHVDHVIPLCGKRVSGLHVASNLRIIPASENIRKGNKY